MSEGYNCSQIVVLYFSEKYNLNTSQFKLASQAFESGMFNADICGAISGAYMILGLEFGDEGRPTLKSKVLEFTNKFIEIIGYKKCKDILNVDISDDQILEIAKNDGTIASNCPRCIEVAISILEDMTKKS